jgi:hypothetical protein
MPALLHAGLVTLARNFPELASRVSRLRLSARDTRADKERVEAELFRGRYHLSSKNDDDLPLVR